ncbi:MAG: carboxymuconolactone decarboxylase family protein [Actinophytocola sp.]|nr:carboxymuconolactone decarboxylase family protein [Actinophytocola sp.]
MARIPVYDVAGAPAASRDRLAALEERHGKVLNIHGEMAHSPAVIAAYAGVQDAIAAHGTLDASTREAIALAVAAADGCDYCQAAHTAAGLRAGLSDDQTKAIRAGNPVSANLDALLAVARTAATNLGEVDDDTCQRAVDAGWMDEELTELFAHIIANMFTNYFNHYARTELDLPPAPALP